MNSKSEKKIEYKGVKFDSLTDDQVLFWIRIRGKKSYFKATYPDSLISSFKKLSKFRTISEYKKDSDVYIDLNKFGAIALEKYELEVIDSCVNELDVIRRCRGLRRISYLEAHELIIKCCRFFIELFKGGQLKLIVSEVNDNYVMDIMARIAHFYGVVVFGTTASFLGANYKIVTVNGEFNHFREPEMQEVQAVCEDLRNRAKSAFAISHFKAIKQAAYNCLSFYYRLVIRHLIGYKILGNISYEYRFTPYLHGFKSYDQLKAIFMLAGPEVLERINPDKAIYIPLHFFPEGSYDYWVRDSLDSNYLESIAKVVKFFIDKGHTVIIKEHPAFYLNRPSIFYKSLLQMNGVIILSPHVTTKEICSKVKKFVVWCGSSGVEALIQGMDVKIVTESYYSNGKLKFYTEETESRLGKGEDVELIQHVLRSTYKN